MSPTICALIPAAGKGSRLGENVPKILVEILPGKTIFDILYSLLAPLVDHFVVILSPSGRPLFEARYWKQITEGRLTLAIQEYPKGMGDAIQCGWEAANRFDHALIVWGDQVSLSEHTVKATIRSLGNHSAAIALPLIELEKPYVDYLIDEPLRKLYEVLQSREGDKTRPIGLSDVGLFGLPTPGVHEAWQKFLTEDPHAVGRNTGELNFLPFVAYLSRELGWPIQRIRVTNQDETRGINTPEDLEHFRRRFS